MFICNINFVFTIIYMAYILHATATYQMYKYSTTYTGCISMSSILTIYTYGKNKKENLIFSKMMFCHYY